MTFTAAMGGVFYLYYDVYDKKGAASPCDSANATGEMKRNKVVSILI